MRTITTPTEIDVPCRWCGERLMVIGENHGDLSLRGCRDLDYIHAVSGSPTCTRTDPAQPYSGWAATAAYETALRARWALEDEDPDAADLRGSEDPPTRNGDEGDERGH